jgi:hypothetical protein
MMGGSTLMTVAMIAMMGGMAFAGARTLLRRRKGLDD